jgi:hypothetical protein
MKTIGTLCEENVPTYEENPMTLLPFPRVRVP